MYFFSFFLSCPFEHIDWTSFEESLSNAGRMLRVVILVYKLFANAHFFRRFSKILFKNLLHIFLTHVFEIEYFCAILRKFDDLEQPICAFVKALLRGQPLRQCALVKWFHFQYRSIESAKMWYFYIEITVLVNSKGNTSRKKPK